MKDGSGALYCFVPQGKTIKAGTHSLTQSCEEVRRSNLKGHAQNIRLFKPLILSNNGIKFNPEGSGLKTWMACKNFIILQSEFIM